MRKLRWLLVLLLVGGAAAADDPKDDATAKDLKAMQGDWQALSMVQDGLPIPEDDAQALFRTVKDDHYTVYRYRQAVGKGTFKVDATRTPRTIDFMPAAPAGGVAKPILGIYEWDGKDRYRVCYTPPGQERPTDFTCKKDSNRTLAVWGREKP
jgi:uncharacterized protein (TIGR03067 family)